MGELYTIVVMNLKPETKEDIKYFLGLFNANLLTYYYRRTFASSKTVFSEVGARQVQELPIKSIEFSSRIEKLSHDEIVKLVDHLLRLNVEIKEFKLQTQIDQIKSKIDYCENRINEIVYQLYGLTEEEIRIVEGDSD